MKLALSTTFLAREDTLIQNRTVDAQTVINFPSRLNQNYIYLRSAVDSGKAGVTDSARHRFSDLSAEWAGHRRTLDTLLGEELARFSAVVKGKGVPAIVTPASP